MQENIPNDNRKIIRLYIENNEIIPISEMDDILGISNDNLGELLFEDLSRIIEECPEEKLQSKTEMFLQKYISR